MSHPLLRHRSIYAAAPCLALLSGCSAAQAPDFLILNSYFPSWLIGALVALVITVLIRTVLIKLDIDDYLPVRFLVYVALWLSISLLFAYIYSPR